MSDESALGDRRTKLEAQRLRLSERINRLEQAIGELEGVPTLRADAAARLAMYQQNLERLLFERGTLDWEIDAIVRSAAPPLGNRRASPF